MALSDALLHNTMAQHSSHDACSSRRAGSFTGVLAPWRDAHTSAGTSREQATVEHNRPQRAPASREFTLGAVNRTQ